MVVLGAVATAWSFVASAQTTSEKCPYGTDDRGRCRPKPVYTLPQRPAPQQVEIITDPNGADLLIAGIPQERKTPLVLRDLRTGTQLEFVRPGYPTHTCAVAVRPYGYQKAEVHLPRPKLDVVPAPSEAPEAISIEYEIYRGKVKETEVVRTGEAIRVSALVPAFEVSSESIPRCTAEPPSDAARRHDPGLYVVRVVAEGYIPFNKVVQLQGEGATVEVKLQRYSSLTVSSDLVHVDFHIARATDAECPTQPNRPELSALDRDQKWTVRKVVPGDYCLYQTGDSLPAEVKRVHLEENQLASIDFTTSNSPLFAPDREAAQQARDQCTSSTSDSESVDCMEYSLYQRASNQESLSTETILSAAASDLQLRCNLEHSAAVLQEHSPSGAQGVVQAAAFGRPSAAKSTSPDTNDEPSLPAWLEVSSKCEAYGWLQQARGKGESARDAYEKACQIGKASACVRLRARSPSQLPPPRAAIVAIGEHTSKAPKQRRKSFFRSPLQNDGFVGGSLAFGMNPWLSSDPWFTQIALVMVGRLGAGADIVAEYPSLILGNLRQDVLDGGSRRRFYGGLGLGVALQFPSASTSPVTLLVGVGGRGLFGTTGGSTSVEARGAVGIRYFGGWLELGARHVLLPAEAAHVPGHEGPVVVEHDWFVIPEARLTVAMGKF